jgi:O-antigen ligase
VRLIDRLGVVASATAWASIPCFPSFITLTNVAFPGISIVPLPVALVLLAAMFVLAIVAGAGLAQPPRQKPTLFVPLLVWLGTILLSLAFGLNLRDGTVFVVIFVFGLIWHAHIDRFYDTPGYARSIWWAYLLSGALASILAIVMVIARVPASLYTIANGRAVGTFVLPGELAGYLLFLLPIAYALGRSAKSAALRMLAWIALGSGAIAMVLTFSRTGWVGLAAGIAFMVVMLARSGRTRFVQGAAIVAAALVIVLAFFNERHNPSENYTRLSIWQAAIGVIERFPLTGVGPFGFSKIYPLVRLPGGDATAFHAHSLYLTFFAELGVLGFLALCWVLWSFAGAWYRIVRERAQPSLLATAIAAGVVGALVQGLIDTVSVVIFGLLLPMLAVGLAAARSGSGDA